MSRDPSDNKQNLPPWLRDQPLPPRPASDEPEAQAGRDTDDAGEAIPDWLRASAATSEPAAEESLPDWLRESASAPEPTPASDETLPDWLRASAVEEPAGGEPLPNWLRESEPSAPAETTGGQSDEAMPDWLRGLAEDPATEAPPQQEISTSSSETVPDWLLAMADETGDADAAAPAPDWLNETAPQTAADQLFASPAAAQPAESTPIEPAAEETADGQNIEDWLNDISMDRVQAAMDEDETPSGAVPFSLEGFGSATDRAPEAPSGPPSWLGADTPDTSSWFDTPPPAATPPEPNDLEDEDAPSWLREIAPESPSETQPSFSSAAEPTPAADDSFDWLQAPSQEPTGQATPEDVPAWLRETAATTDDAATPPWLREANTEVEPDQATAPDWLHAAEPTTEPSVGPAASDASADWLHEPTSAPQASDDQSLPVWLRDDQTPAAPTTPTAQDDGDIPPWLRDEQGATIAEHPSEQALPPWLKGANANEPEVPVMAQPAPERPVEPEPIDSWFDQAVSGADTIPEPAAESEFFGGTDLPAWLRPREQPATATNTADSRALDWLTRIGSPEDEVAVPAIATARFAPPPSPVKTEEQNRAIALLTQLAEAPTVPSPQPIAVPAGSKRRLANEWLLYLLLLLALLVAPFLPGLTTPLQVPPSSPSAQRLYDQIQTLGPDDVVLIGYDWDARRVAELRPLESAVIDQLVAQKVKLVLMSTDPQGSLLLYDLREKLNLAGYQPRGEDYILLGYQPGGELALRAVAQNFGQLLRSDFQDEDMSTSRLALGTSTGTNTALTSLNNFSMIMLLADDQADVQSWMEQVQRAAPSVPFAALLTAEAAPATEPYLSLPNVYGLSGATGALAYTTLRGGDTTQVAAQAGLLRAGLLVFVLLLLIGAIGSSIRNATRRRTA